MSEPVHPVVDLALARRLERCEGKNNVAFVESRARLSPATNATWIERAGAYALFDGPGSPLTQTFGLGLFATPSDDDLAAIEDFFTGRGASVFHEVSPLAGIDVAAMLHARGYRPVELTSVLYRPVAATFDRGRLSVVARRASSHESELWSRVSAEGWSESPELSEFVRDIGRVSMNSSGMTAFFAELDGSPVGTGAVAIHDGTAILAGASTIPSARRLGAQRALLEARLAFASENGCDLATMSAAPGSASQRNAERQGFRIAYTRMKWGK
jgi:GNAT superfamily N-acetyltransferase